MLKHLVYWCFHILAQPDGHGDFDLEKGLQQQQLAAPPLHTWSSYVMLHGQV